MRNLYTLFSCLIVAGLLMPGMVSAQEIIQMEVVRHNTSGPLHSMSVPEATEGFLAPFEIPNKLFKFGSLRNAESEQTQLASDPVKQSNYSGASAKIAQSFDGSSDDDNAAVLGFRVVPPDTDGDVGPRHYVQWINSVSEIFDKRGNTIMGPFPGNLYFQGMGGLCETTNNGDPIVLYDEGADRWNVSQFALDFANLQFSMCVAISTTGDPTGSYHQYEIQFGNIFPDYPKLGIWGDSYLMTTRNFVGASGQFAIVMDRHAMLNGEPTDVIAAVIPQDFIVDGRQPMDSDDPNISGPALFGGHTAFGATKGNRDAKEFEIYAFDVDWTNPDPISTASFEKIAEVPLPAYNINNGPYIFQPNGQALDDLEAFTMFRSQVRDFGTHRSMVANHTVKLNPNRTAGVRWYEFREEGSGWYLYQSGTYSPDNSHRWMASIAMNGRGDIALGYSLTSDTEYPSIYVTGQTADYSGTGIMNVAETLLHAGGGSQEGASRWGDYSMMSVDPKDDRTFWYTQEYYEETGAFDFNTRIASFRLPVSNAAADATAEAGVAATDQLTLGVDEVPTEFGLAQNHPNPFNPTTLVNFTMPQAGHVSVKVYNLLGQEVATLVNEVRDAGSHVVNFDAAGLSSGVYLYVMQSAEFTATRRMTLLK